MYEYASVVFRIIILIGVRILFLRSFLQGVWRCPVFDEQQDKSHAFLLLILKEMLNFWGLGERRKFLFMSDIVDNIIEELKIHFMEEAIPYIQEQVGKVVQGIKEEMRPMLKELFDSFKSGKQANTKLFKLPLLDKNKLVEIVRENMVIGAKEVAVYKSTTEKAYIVYLAYTCNKELLSIEKNKYIIIEAQSLSADVENLFNGERMIILK